ncbi:helix-turn-helix domain-containing protein, partial [Planktotalea sp.]|uniref:GlxA family transcriptional regulator n=1 Tax=Planktotalea sp. TaxID=2029877 RepID=UPI00329A3D8C
IDDHDVVTAGGVMAWIDLGLHLIRLWMGPAIVSRTCKHMLIDPASREQRSYRSFRPPLGHGDDQIRSLQLWLESHLSTPLTVAQLATQAGMSTRSLQRRFHKVTGMALRSYLQALRIEKAKAMLETTSLPIAQICWNVGYQDVSAFSRLFVAQTGLTAGEYRKKFNVV